MSSYLIQITLLNTTLCVVWAWCVIKCVLVSFILREKEREEKKSVCDKNVIFLPT